MIGLNWRPGRGGVFDRSLVLRASDRRIKKVLSKFGAFTRQRAKTSIRKRKRISSPGGPPSGHAGHLRKFILFAVDMNRRSVVIGPVLYPRAKGKGALPALEYGGRSRVMRRSPARRGQQRAVQEETITVKARPFMGPAFEQELAGLPDLWRDSIR